MGLLRDDEVTINLALFKRYRFYHIFNPNSPRIFDYHGYRLFTVVYIAVMMVATVYSTLGLVVDTGDTVDSIDVTLCMFIYTVTAISFLKICVFLYKADGVWDLFDFTRLDFLASSRCRDNVAVLLRSRETSVKVTNVFQNYFTAVFVTWMFAPLIFNTFVGIDDPNQRYQNIFNLRYPVDATFYNRNFHVFYATEVALGLFILYYSVIVDNFLISMCMSTIAQYEVLYLAFESIGNDDRSADARGRNKNNSLRVCEDFIETLSDQQLMYTKLKSFYSIVWIVVVLLIFGNSLSMIVLSYSFVLICVSPSLSIFKLIKLPMAFFCFAIQIFMYCYLFDVLNEKKESANSRIYHCNWTNTDIKFKKLLLFAMQMNDSNRLKIKTTQTKIVNLQLFASVMSTTYNIVSVMLNQELKSRKKGGSK